MTSCHKPTSREYLNLFREREAEAEQLVKTAKAGGDRFQQEQAKKLLEEWRRLIIRAESAEG